MNLLRIQTLVDESPGNVSAPGRLAALEGPIGKVTSSTSYITEPRTSKQDAGVQDAVRYVRAARNFLQIAVFRLDESGFHCDALSELYAGSASLVSAWSGRSRQPVTEPLPQSFADAAREWRRQHGRTY